MELLFPPGKVIAYSQGTLSTRMENLECFPGWRLSELENIFVINSGYRYTNKVVSNAYVSPNDTDVMKHEDKSFLTLITCDTYDEKIGIYLRRVVVRAALIGMRRIIK